MNGIETFIKIDLMALCRILCDCPENSLCDRWFDDCFSENDYNLLIYYSMGRKVVTCYKLRNHDKYFLDISLSCTYINYPGSSETCKILLDSNIPEPIYDHPTLDPWLYQ